MEVKLTGRYDLDKSNLLKGDLHLVIGTRKKPSANKPKHYLLVKTGSTFFYLSSIYPFNQDAPQGATDAQIFSFDWQGSYYLLNLETAGKQAEISLMETGNNAAKLQQGGGTGSKPL